MGLEDALPTYVCVDLLWTIVLIVIIAVPAVVASADLRAYTHAIADLDPFDFGSDSHSLTDNFMPKGREHIRLDLSLGRCGMHLPNYEWHLHFAPTFGYCMNIRATDTEKYVRMISPQLSAF